MTEELPSEEGFAAVERLASQTSFWMVERDGDAPSKGDCAGWGPSRPTARRRQAGGDYNAADVKAKRAKEQGSQPECPKNKKRRTRSEGPADLRYTSFSPVGIRIKEVGGWEKTSSNSSVVRVLHAQQGCSRAFVQGCR